MSLEKIRQQLADHVYKLLEAEYPPYRIIREPDLIHSLERATALGAALWAMSCHNGNQSKSAIRCGINRNTFRKVLDEKLVMEEEAKYAAAEVLGLNVFGPPR